MLTRKEQERGQLTNVEITVLVNSRVVSVFCLCSTVFPTFPTIKAEFFVRQWGRGS